MPDGSSGDRQERSARQQMLRMSEMAAAHFAAALKGRDGEECRAYVERRGLSPDIVERFGLGWARRDWQSLAGALQRGGFSEKLAVECGLLGQSDRGRAYDRFRGRLMFPIKNLSNQIIAFGGRIIADEDEAKYINSADTPIYKKGDHLYGLAQARKGITTKGKALLTEGYMDVLTLHQFGYDNAVGVLGTALTRSRSSAFPALPPGWCCSLTGDRAGRKAALRSCEMLLTRGLACTVVLMPDGEDIDSLLRTQGPEAFEALLDKAPDGLRFLRGRAAHAGPARDRGMGAPLPRAGGGAGAAQPVRLASGHASAALGGAAARGPCPAPPGRAAARSPVRRNGSAGTCATCRSCFLPCAIRSA